MPVSTMANVANRRILYQQFIRRGSCGGGERPGSMDGNQQSGAELVALRDGPIAICDTAYGRFEEQKKRDVERAYQKMTAAEKGVFR